MTEQPPKKVKVLTRLRIDEVSAVDAGAGKGVKVMLMKRDDSADDNRPVEMPEHERRYWAALGATALRRAEERFRKEHGVGYADHESEDDEVENPFLKYFRRPKVSKVVEGQDEAPPGEDGRDEIADQVEDALDQDSDGKPDADGGNDHPAHQAADLLIEAGKFSDRAEALDYLLHNPRGAAMLARLHKHEDQPIMSTPEDKLRDLAKRAGIVAICKVLVEDDDAHGISEHELTELVTEQAKRDHPDLSAAQAFARAFSAQDEAGIILRRAFNVCKNSALQADVDDSADAMRELVEIGERRWPSLTTAQQFARAFETNPELARKAHRRPSVFSTRFPFPKY